MFLRVSVALDDLGVGRHPLDDLRVLLDLLPDLGDGLLLCVERPGLHAALRLQGLHDVLVLPPDLVGQAAQGAELKYME